MKKALLMSVFCLIAGCNLTPQEEYIPEEEYLSEEEYFSADKPIAETTPYIQETGAPLPMPTTYQAAMDQPQYLSQTQPFPQNTSPAYPVTVSYPQVAPQPLQVQAQSMYTQPSMTSMVQPVQAPSVYVSYPVMPTAQPDLMPMGYNIPDVVLLQHPNAIATFVQCAITDTGCITSYQQQGYILLQSKPQSAGYYLTPAAADYPGGRWGSQTIMPRW